MQQDIGIRTSLTVNDVLDSYIKEHVSEKVVAKDRQEYGADHIKGFLGTRCVSAIDIPASREYVKHRLVEGAAASTIRRELNILSAAANHGLRWRRIGPNDMPQIELPEIGESEEVLWFSKDQVKAMFAARPATTHFGCFLHLCYYTGARRDSIERLWKSQVNRELGCVHLARPKEKKTKKRRPTVPIYPETRPAIDWLFEHSGTEWLFGRYRDFYKPFVKLCEELGFEGHPHMLRHSRATHMLMDRENPFKVANLLGDSLTTVLKVYGHVCVEYLHTESTVEAMLA